jgi:opacity protein-like surface antigen
MKLYLFTYWEVIMKHSYGIVGIIFMLSALNLNSQDFAKMGIWELGGNISYTSITGVNNGETSENSLGTFTLDVPVYYFVIDGLALGLIPSYINLSFGESSASEFDILFGLAYNISTNSQAYPYGEGRIGYNTTSNGDSESGIVWAVIGGVKVQVGGNALINIGIEYSQSTLERSGNEGGRDGTNLFAIRAGLAIFIGP